MLLEWEVRGEGVVLARERGGVNGNSVWERLGGSIELGTTIPKPQICPIRMFTSLLVVRFCIKHAILKKIKQKLHMYEV